MIRSRGLRGIATAALLALLAGCAPVTGTQSTAQSGTRSPVNKTVELIVGKGPVDHDVQVSRKNKDTVSWKNRDGRGQTLRFDAWPFAEPWQEIYIKSGQLVGPYHIYDDGRTGKKTFHYHVVPGIKGDPGDPDPPGVVVND